MFDVIVIGGGHAGVEAAHAVYRQGLTCCLVTFNTETIGQMSCNPAIGGLGKSHLVREVDALGGIMAQATDRAGIQSRTLNTRKGFAVQALRVQCDRDRYKQAIQELLSETNIVIKEGEVVDIVIDQNIIQGVELSTGEKISSIKTILTTGTFLNGVMFKGKEKISGGRVGDDSAIPLSKKLYKLKLPMGRLKTGTPARIKLSSINLDVMEEQPGDANPPSMSVLQPPKKILPQISCYITRTNKHTHKIISDNKAVAEYIFEEYGSNSSVIQYGGDHINFRKKPDKPTIPFKNISSYFLSICRIEPENNINMILEAFRITPKKNIIFNCESWGS